MLSFKPTVKKRWPWITAFMVVVVSGVYVLVFANAPLPSMTVEQLVFTQQVDTMQSEPIDWPQANQSAIFIPDLNVKQSFGDQQARPTASVAKAITALALMRKAPLSSGEAGPIIRITPEDVAIYNEYVAGGGSVFAVSVGQELSQYQAMQALLLPSANNMAVTLTRWAFGSDQSYLDYANQMVKDLGMKNTIVADASGFSEQTVSTTEDLVILGKHVHDNPVLAEIVNQRSAQILGREVKNVNTSLGVDGIDGIKTGFTFAAGGCLLFSSTQQVLGQPTTVIGAILGAETRDMALADAPTVVKTSFPNIIQISPVKENQVFAYVKTAWGQQTELVAKQGVSKVLWKGESASLEVSINNELLSGQIKLGDKTADLRLENTITQPDLWWRLTHPQILVASYVQ